MKYEWYRIGSFRQLSYNIAKSPKHTEPQISSSASLQIRRLWSRRWILFCCPGCCISGWRNVVSWLRINSTLSWGNSCCPATQHPSSRGWGSRNELDWSMWGELREGCPSLNRGQEPQVQPQAPAASWQGSLLGWPLAQATEQKHWPFLEITEELLTSQVQLRQAHLTTVAVIDLLRIEYF